MYLGTVVVVLLVLAAYFFDVPGRFSGAPPAETHRVDPAPEQTADPAPARDQHHVADRAPLSEGDGRWVYVTAQDAKARLEGEQANAMALAALTASESQAAARLDGLQKRLEGEQAQSTKLSQDLADARARLAESVREGAAGQERRQSLELTAATLEAKLQAEQQRSTGLAARVAEVERDSAAQTGLLREQFAKEQARAEERDGDLVAAQALLAHAATEGTDEHPAPQAPASEQERQAQPAAAGQTAAGSVLPAPDEPSRLVPSTKGPAPDATAASARTPEAGAGAAPSRAATAPLIASGAAGEPVLPAGMPARILLRYARNSEPARSRAAALALALQAQGLEVADPVAAPPGPSGETVTFFYGDDQASAKRVAAVTVAPAPLQGRLSANAPLPRPGTIEVAIGG